MKYRCKIHPYKAKALWKNIRSAFCRIKGNRTLCFLMIRQGLKKAKQRRFAASYIYRSKTSLFRFFHYKEKRRTKV